MFKTPQGKCYGATNAILRTISLSLYALAAVSDPSLAREAIVDDGHPDQKISKQKHSQLHINRGIRLYEHRNYSAAAKEYTLAIRLTPNVAILYYNRGNAYFRLRSFENALQDYTVAERLNPYFVMAMANRGNALSALDRLDDALAAFNAAAELEPDNPYVLFNRGFVYGRLKEYHSAIRDFTKLLELNPNDADALALRATVVDVSFWDRAALCGAPFLLRHSAANGPIPSNDSHCLNGSYERMI